MMTMNNKRGLAIAFLGCFLAGCTQVSAPVGRVCTYQASKDSQNVLGQDAKFVVQEQDGNTIFTYQSLPSVPIAETIELNAKRELIFANTDFDTARVILLQNQEYFTQLVGTETSKGFEAVNEFLVCQ